MNVRTAEAVAGAWERFEQALKRVSPKTHATLLPGATEEDLKEAERILEMPFAEDIRAFYRAHNGEEPTDEASDGVFAFAYFIPLVGNVDSAVSESLMWDEMVKMPNPSGYQPRMKGRKFTWEMTLHWLTFAKDYGGNSLIVDCKTGEVILYDHESNIEMKIIAASLVDFLEKETLKLDAGKKKKKEEETKEKDDDDFFDDADLDEEGDEDDEEDGDEEEEDDNEFEDLDLDEEFFSDEDGDDDDEDDDEDEDGDDDADDDEEPDAKLASSSTPGARTIEDRPWLEVAVRLPGIKNRAPGTLIQTETMKAMDVTVEILDPAVTKDPHADPKRTVAVTLYSTSNPGFQILEGYGGDATLDQASFFKDARVFTPVGAGLFYDTVKKGSRHSFPVLYWVHEEDLDDEMGIVLELRRRQPR